MSSLEVILFRLVLAAFLGAVLGAEREKNARPAGLRTHILVSTGSALMMLVSTEALLKIAVENNTKYDPARIAAQVVSGIGFLGAGTIMRDGVNVNGLTTAASLWVSAGIGLAVGSGYYQGAIVASLIGFVCLRYLVILEKKIAKASFYIFQVYVQDYSYSLSAICNTFESVNYEVKQIKSERTKDYNNTNQLVISFIVKPKAHTDLYHVCHQLYQIGNIKKILCINYADGTLETKYPK